MVSKKASADDVKKTAVQTAADENAAPKRRNQKNCFKAGSFQDCQGKCI